MGKKARLFQKGTASVPVILGLLLTALALPAGLKLVQQEQEFRREAAGDYAYPIISDSRTRTSDNCVALDYISPYCQTQCGGDKSYKLWSWHEPGEKPANWFGLPAGIGMPLYNPDQTDECQEPKIGHTCATKAEMQSAGLDECVPYGDASSGKKVKPDRENWQCEPQSWQWGVCGEGDCSETEKLRVRSYKWVDENGDTHGTCGSEIEHECIVSEDCGGSEETIRCFLDCRGMNAIVHTGGIHSVNVFAFKKDAPLEKCQPLRGISDVEVTLTNPNSGHTWTGKTDHYGSVGLGPVDDKVYKQECFGTKCRRKDGEYYRVSLKKSGYIDGECQGSYVIPSAVVGSSLTGTPEPTNTSMPPPTEFYPSPVEKERPRGDANGDGVVNVADFSVWRKEKFDQKADETKGDWQSDFNRDGFIKNDDFSIWLNNLD